jgi:transposase
MKNIEESTLSVNQFFNTNNSPFSKSQYYIYKKILETKGTEGLSDKRIEGNNLKFSDNIKNYVQGLVRHNPFISTIEIQIEIESHFNIKISNTTIKNFRRDTGLICVHPEKEDNPVFESSAAEIPLALALGTGLMDMFTDSIGQSIEEKRTSGVLERSEQLEKDHPDLRANGKFTSEYNNLQSVRESRFKPIEEKISHKRFSAMDIFSFARKTILRRTLSLFSLPLVTENGKTSSVDCPSGNALQALCSFNYKAATLTKYIAELKYLQISNNLIDATARFWMGFWHNRKNSDTIFACYYLDGNTKALWSSKSCYKGKVTMLGRVMNCLEQVFIHDGQGHPIYFQTFNGHANIGKNALGMLDKIEEYLKDTTTLEDQFTVNRILIMDGGGNGVKTLRELSNSGYHFITILDSNQINDRKIKSVSKEKRYDFGDAFLLDCTIELEDSNEKKYLFETRAVKVHWDNGRTSILITSLGEEIFSTDNVVKSYFDRWPAQELNFKDMKSSVNIHRIVGYGKKLVENQTVLNKIELLQRQKNKLESELKIPIDKIKDLEISLQKKITEEKVYKEKSIIVNGLRILPDQDLKSLECVQKEINSIKRMIQKIKDEYPKQFKLLKRKNDELARIVDKKKIYYVDVELDQIMTCFKISMANICCYLLDDCFKGQKMTLNRLFEEIFNLRAEVKIENYCRNVTIKKNHKQLDIMKRLESALSIINDMKLKDMNGYQYNFTLI